MCVPFELAASALDSTMLLPGLAPENVGPIARLEDSWDGAMDMDVEPLSGGEWEKGRSVM